MTRTLWRGGLAAGLAAVAAAAFVAMGAMAAQPGSAPKKKTYVLGLIAKSQSNPVFLAARTGAEDAARELGEKMGVTIKIDWQTPVSEDGQKQAEKLEQLVASGVDGVAISCSDANIATMAIDAAVDKGVPVVCFDSDAPRSKRFAYYGTDDEACGRQVAAELAKAMGGKGVVAILAGNQNAPNLQARVKGVKEGMAKFPDIKVLDTYYHGETAQDAVAKIEQVQGANPQITGWAFVGGWPLYTENALDKVRGKAKVVSVDALPQCLAYVKSGDVEVLLGQKVYEWGYESVELLMDKIANKKEPSSPIVKADLVPVTAANADEYGKNWDKWLGKKK
ncbi:MAG: substrate-binding domain-containing protein [Phycisphaeraceae bacterium]|nr:substrate-binding domain-containing protein [Phycisphaeraceae bacterium]